MTDIIDPFADDARFKNLVDPFADDARFKISTSHPPPETPRKPVSAAEQKARAPASHHGGFGAQVSVALGRNPTTETKSEAFGETITGFGAGAAKNITGVGELLPNRYGGEYAAKWTQYLDTIGTPEVRARGQFFGALAPGLGAAKVLGAFAPTTTALGRIVASAAGGGLAGAMEATGETDEKKRAVEKMKAAGLGLTVGGGLAAAGPAAVGLARATKKAWDYTGGLVGRAAGKATKMEAEALRAGAAEETERVAAVEGRKAETAGWKEAEAEAEAAKEREAARKVLEEHGARPAQSAVDFGAKAQPYLEKYEQKYRGAREKESGFKQMMEKADERIVSTRPVIEYIDKVLLNVPKKSALRDELTKIRLNLGAKKDAATSLTVAERIRKDMNRVATGKAPMAESGVGAASADERKVITDVLKELRKSTEAAIPEYAGVMAKYAEMSRPLDPFRRGEALHGLASRDPFSKEFVKNPADVTAALVRQANKGDDSLALVVAEHPEIRDEARQYFNQLLFGPKAEPKKVTAEALSKFNRDNEAALKALGLTEDFASVRSARESAEAATLSAAEREKTMAELSKGREAATKKAADFERARQDLAVLSDPRFLQDAPEKVRAIVKSLDKSGHLNPGQYEDFVRQARDIETKFKDSAKAKKQLIILGTAVLGSAGTLGWFGNRFISQSIFGGH